MDCGLLITVPVLMPTPAPTSMPASFPARGCRRFCRLGGGTGLQDAGDRPAQAGVMSPVPWLRDNASEHPGQQH